VKHTLAVSLFSVGALSIASCGQPSRTYNPSTMTTGSAANSSGPGGILTDEYVQGGSRFCVYDDLGSPVTLTVNAAQVCPMSPRSPGVSPQVRRGILREQHVEGMNRVCIYDDLGQPVAITVRSTQFCP
jgi:hypothetical protein